MSARWSASPPTAAAERAESLADLIAAADDEALSFRRGQPTLGTHGYELLRRAVHGRDEAAWRAVIALYRNLVLAWVRRHPAWSDATPMAPDDWVFTVFGRFAAAMTPERFATFATLPAVLFYLKRCAASAVLDACRESRQAAHLVRPPDDWEGPASGDPDPEAEVIDHLSTLELWQVVLTTAKDEAERVFAERRFRQGLTPREIQRRHDDLFPTMAAVYQCGRNLLERLRRRPELRYRHGAAPAAVA